MSPETEMKAFGILVITRDPLSLGALWAMAESRCWKLTSVSTGWQALEHLKAHATTPLVVLDLTPGDADGLSTLGWLHRVRPELPIVVISHSVDPEQKQEVLRFGAKEYLVRPIDATALEHAIIPYVEPAEGGNRAYLDAEQIEAFGDETFFVAAGSNMRKLRNQIELLAQTDSPLLIVGESGTGKQLVARLVHKLSVRSGFRFAKVNCAVVSENILDTQIFGRSFATEDGSASVAGKLAGTQPGTVFFHGIEELSPDAQAKLLHHLQDEQLKKRELQSHPSARVLASLRDVGNGLQKKRLREDLYFHLSSFVLHIPPLRHRVEDIPFLLSYFMKQQAKLYGFPVRTISSSLAQACCRQPWPGNLVEMQELIKRYLVTGDEIMVLAELETTSGGKARLPETRDRDHSSNRLNNDLSAGLRSLVESAKATAERNAIASALMQTQWNRKAAARLLRVSYRTLLYKIEHYRMSPPVLHFSGYANGIALKGHRRSN